MTTLDEMNQKADRLRTVFDEATAAFREHFSEDEYNWKTGFSTYVLNDEAKARELMDAIEFFHGCKAKLIIEEHPECGHTVYQVSSEGYIC